MRKQVNSLPKTKSGAPDFAMAAHITWPNFTKLLFMKEEFTGRKISSCPEYAPNTGENCDSQSFDDIDKQQSEEDLMQRIPEASAMVSDESKCQIWTSTASTTRDERSRLKRKRSIKECYDNVEQEKLKLLKESFEISKQKMEEKKDPLAVFAMDLVNDLKQIEDRKILVQTKLELKQITTKALLKQLEAASAEGESCTVQTHQVSASYVQEASNEPHLFSNLSTDQL